MRPGQTGRDMIKTKQAFKLHTTSPWKELDVLYNLMDADRAYLHLSRTPPKSDLDDTINNATNNLFQQRYSQRY